MSLFINWFEKHLNWTVFLYTIFAWMFAISLVSFTLDITGIKSITGPGLVGGWSFTINTVIDVAVLISLPVYFLVLKKKKHSLWFLVLFLPPLVPIYFGYVIFYLMPFWIIGWITLISLKNKTLDEGTNKTVPVSANHKS